MLDELVLSSYHTPRYSALPLSYQDSLVYCEFETLEGREEEFRIADLHRKVFCSPGCSMSPFVRKFRLGEGSY